MGKITSFDMPYSTQQPKLIMPEYGRNVQQLVEYAKTITDKERRQAVCGEIVNLIEQLYPQSRNIEDYRDKLWQHLFQIAHFDIDVDTPNGETPVPEDLKRKPQNIPYPKGTTSFRHYGNHTRTLIASASEMEDGAIKDEFVKVIASYMKLTYNTFNRDHYITDEVIKGDLDTLSKGKLGAADGAIESLNAKSLRQTQLPPSRSNNNRTSNNRSNNGNTNRPQTNNRNNNPNSKPSGNNNNLKNRKK
ncbi:MAG: hypothetical protein RL757_1923 [Bacteroidota bacterium]|jgi:hypothetical protein